MTLEISLTKHSKKKYPQGKRPQEKPDEPDNAENNIPPTEPAVSPTQEAAAEKQLSFLFWLRVGLAVMGGIISEFALESIEGEERRWASIAILIIIYIISYGIAKGMRIPSPPSSKKKLVTTGIGSYVFIFLFTWILIHTIINSLTGIDSTLFT